MNNEFDKTKDKQIKRGNPNWEKGKSANPDGRPRGSKNWGTILEEAIEKVQETKDETILERFVMQAYTKPQVMIALVKKLVADKTHTQIEEMENPEITMARARESFNAKLDNISQRAEDLEEVEKGNKDTGPEPKEPDNKSNTISKVRIEKDISVEKEDKNKEISVSKGMGYGKYSKVTIK